MDYALLQAQPLLQQQQQHPHQQRLLNPAQASVGTPRVSVQIAKHSGETVRFFCI